MSADASELLSRWFERRCAGRPISPAELCAEDPDRLPELIRRIEAIEAIEAAIEPRSGGAESPPGGAALDDTDPTPLPRRTRTNTSSVPPGYDVIEELGRGGMGVVYKVRHLPLGRVVALKMILTGGHAAADDRARFLAEAAAVARLRHPNIVLLLEYGEHDGVPYFTQEFAPGGSLADRLAAGRLPPGQAADLVEHLARGVQAAHDHGVVHRDLKPANVLLDGDGNPKVADFGMARLTDAGGGLTASGAVVGTPGYMAPEQARGDARRAGPAADVCGLGAVLYECLTGRPPFRGPTPVDTVLQVLDREAVPVRTVRPGVPADLATVCHKCLRKEPRERYASARELADDLRRWRAGESIRARPVGSVERAVKWVRRKPSAAAAYALVLFAAVVTGLGGGATWLWRRAEDARGEAEAARGRLADLSYLHQVGLAHREWQDAEVARAEALLAACPPDQRGWEWRYVNRLCRSELLRLDGHTGPLLAVAYSPDGRRLVTAAGDLTVWDAATGARLFTLRGHTGAVHGVAYTADATRIVTGGGDHTARVWDAETGREERVVRFPGHVSSVAVAPDGRTAAAGVNGHGVIMWDVGTGETVRTFADLTGYLNGVAFSPDGRLIAACNEAGRRGRVAAWDVGAGRTVLSVDHAHGFGGLTFSPDGRRIAAGGMDRTVRVWDAATGRPDLVLSGHTDRVTGVAFSRDGSRLVTSASDQTARVWDAVTGRETAVYRGHTGSVSGAAFGADARTFATVSSDGTARVWDATADPQARVLPGHAGALAGVGVGPDGRTLATAGADGTVRLWDVSTGRPGLVIRAHSGSAQGVAVSPDGRRVVSSGDDGLVRAWDAASGDPRWVARGHTAPVLSVQYSPDGALVASAGGSYDRANCLTFSEVKVWDARDGREVAALAGRTRGYGCVAFSPDGRRLAAGGDRTVAVWDLTTGRQSVCVDGHGDSVVGLAFSPDGRLLASASYDHAVKLWDAADGREVWAFRGHTDRVTCVAFSPDGRRIVSGGDDRAIRVVVARTGEEALSVKGTTGPVHAVGFTPDGHFLVSGGWDGLACVWDARPPD